MKKKLGANTEVVALYDKMIAEGSHWVITCDPNTSAVQALTDDGLKALCSVFRTHGMPEDVINRMGRKRDGHYFVAIGLDSGVDELARMLSEVYGLPGVIGATDKRIDDIPAFPH